jgi:hypothetical protein
MISIPERHARGQLYVIFYYIVPGIFHVLAKTTDQFYEFNNLTILRLQNTGRSV